MIHNSPIEQQRSAGAVHGADEATRRGYLDRAYALGRGSERASAIERNAGPVA